MSPASKKLYIRTQGCQMNEYDSSRMVDLLKSVGYQRVDDPEQADLILLNTCSIRHKAEEKVFSDLGRLRPLKERRPEVVIAVGGCVGSQEGAALQKRAPYVDVVFGPQTLHRLPELLQAAADTKKPVVDISFPEIEKFDRLPEPEANGPTAYVSIMEGCSKYCSYCVVPYTRGEEIHRSFDDVIAECVGLAKQGVREITLLGQNVNAYKGLKHDGERADLALLITYVAEIEGIERIRFTTSHPVEFSDNLIQAYAEVPQLADHLHLPVQSGSDRILTLMKRGHTALEYKSKIRKLRTVRPNISISSDFIVGFPGETDDDFAATLKLVEEIGFDHSFSFIYSQRPGTPAAGYQDNVVLETKKQRLNLLQKRILQHAGQVSQSMLGRVERVLITGPSQNHPTLWNGRTDNNRVVQFENLHAKAGDFVSVHITKTGLYNLEGRLENELVGVD